MSTRTITYDLTLISGSAAASKVVTFDLLTPLAARTTDTVVQVSFSSTADENGEGTVTLAVPSSGAYLYNCTLPDGQSFRFSLAAGDATTLHALMAATVGSTVTSADAITTAVDAAITTHNADTTSVHGITDTSALVTTSDYTADDVLSKLLTVDGTGTGLDADTVDGSHASAFEAAGTVATHIADTSAVHDVTSLGTSTGSSTDMLRVAAAGGLEYRTTAQVLGDIGAAPTASPTFTGTVTLPTTIASVIKPSSDSTTALKLTKADGVTSVLTVDTTNSQLILNPTSVDAKGLIIGASAMPFGVSLYIENGTPDFRQKIVRASGGLASNFMNVWVKNSTTNLETEAFAFGTLANVQNGATPPSISYIYMSSLASPAYNNANFFMLPSGYIGIGTGNNAPTARLDIAASTTAAASLRIRSGTAPTSPNDGDIWYDGSNLKIRIGATTYSVDVTAV